MPASLRGVHIRGQGFALASESASSVIISRLPGRRHHKRHGLTAVGMRFCVCSLQATEVSVTSQDVRSATQQHEQQREKEARKHAREIAEQKELHTVLAGARGPAPVRKRQRTADRLRATQSQEAQELAAPEPVHLPGVNVPGGPGHWLASVHPTPGPPVRAPASQPSPAEALALVSNVAAWATNAQLAANLAVHSASPASASTAHSALVAVGRALAPALAAYGHGHVAPHLELADERLTSQEGGREEAPADELEHVEEEGSASDSDSGSSSSGAAVTPLRKRPRPEQGVTTSG